MSKIKILLLFGTRPEVIKMAALIPLLQQESDAFELKICDTGQHLELKQPILDFFQIKPDYSLNALQHSQTLAGLSAYLLQALPTVLEDFKPDILLVQGDTTSALIGGLAGFYAKIKVAHLEAGLRTHQQWNPFPEEINRKMLSHLAHIHFAPTELAVQNLLAEGIAKETIYLVGNTVIDALHLALQKIKEAKPSSISILENQMKPLREQYGKMLLFTLHRRENLENHLPEIGAALAEILKQEDCFALFPVHLNPTVQQWAVKLSKKLPNLILVEPLPYEAFVWAMQTCDLILTDSGGIQEEAPTLGKPVLVLRAWTERPEATTHGTVFQLSIDRQTVVETTKRLLQQSPATLSTPNPFGDGNAAGRILSILKEHFKNVTSVPRNDLLQG